MEWAMNRGISNARRLEDFMVLSIAFVSKFNDQSVMKTSAVGAAHC
jgi:hypothetical protein